MSASTEGKDRTHVESSSNKPPTKRDTEPGTQQASSACSARGWVQATGALHTMMAMRSHLRFRLTYT